MRMIDVRIQGSWLRRRGVRGRWITVYLHRYGGSESTERMHSHPWVLAFGIVLRGRLLEFVGRTGVLRGAAVSCQSGCTVKGQCTGSRTAMH